MRLFKFLQQSLRLRARACLPQRRDDHEDKSGQDIQQGHVERDKVLRKDGDRFPTIEQVEVQAEEEQAGRSDQQHQADLKEQAGYFSDQREQGKTIFLSSHLLGELEQVTDWLVMLHHGKALFSGPAREFLDRRGELVVEAEEATQLDLVARIAITAGYTVTLVNGSLRIACPLDWASELNRRAREAGATRIAIQAREASLEERFLALLKGEH